jgi:hypothetical protein
MSGTKRIDGRAQQDFAKKRSKKKARFWAGFKLLSWRRIVETGVIMLRRHIYVQF